VERGEKVVVQFERPNCSESEQLWQNACMAKKKKETVRDKARQQRERAKSAEDRAKKGSREDFSQAAARTVREATKD
jgi:hypothetical protein